MPVPKEIECSFHSMQRSSILFSSELFLFSFVILQITRKRSLQDLAIGATVLAVVTKHVPYSNQQQQSSD